MLTLCEAPAGAALRHGVAVVTFEAPQPVGASDEALAVAAAQGARSAFEALVERYAGRVVAVATRRIGDHDLARDLSQDVWVRVFRALPKFRSGGGSFRSWLFAIVLNATRDEQRRRRRSPVRYAEDLGQPVDRRDHAQRVAIDDALGDVDEPYRSALVLVDVEGLTYDEAARALGCAVGTAKSRVHRGRLAFREQWMKTRTDDEVSRSVPHVRPGGRRRTIR